MLLHVRCNRYTVHAVAAPAAPGGPPPPAAANVFAAFAILFIFFANFLASLPFADGVAAADAARFLFSLSDFSNSAAAAAAVAAAAASATVAAASAAVAPLPLPLPLPPHCFNLTTELKGFAKTQGGYVQARVFSTKKTRRSGP